MNVSRRAFLRGAPKVVAGTVAVAASPSLLEKALQSLKPKIRRRTIRTGLPVPQWRKLHEGVRSLTHPDHPVNARNRILDDLPWKEDA